MLLNLTFWSLIEIHPGINFLNFQFSKVCFPQYLCIICYYIITVLLYIYLTFFLIETLAYMIDAVYIALL